ncbi:hypothetical protein FA13DRAFT_1703815 [Coprinellus micaceus]|uniref:Uncharacterized protein n=1 Tax=Coprinellus micaceus TaxID=71717 RepID=A0A4Y7TZB3_COPMI|nr:hypothetical protein FA13DRAFT_1703815 [Coprinellus micaceus]
MRFFATLAVVFVAAVVFVSATPIPSEYQFDLDTREFSNEATLFERAGLWGGVKNAAKSTWDYAAKKIFRIGTQQSPRPAGPGPFSRPAFVAEPRHPEGRGRGPMFALAGPPPALGSRNQADVSSAGA